MIPHEIKEGLTRSFVLFLVFVVGQATLGPLTGEAIFAGASLGLGYGYGWWARITHLNDKLQAEIDRRNAEADARLGEDATYRED